MAQPVTTRRVVVTSFLVNLSDILTNLVVLWLTGSAVIFAEFAKGGADALGSLLLVVGHRRARRPQSAEHPRGHGRETFFWALLSALVLLVLGGGLTLMRGLERLVHPLAPQRAWLAVAVLCLSILTNGYAVRQSVRRLRAGGRSLRHGFRETGQPLVNTALLQDGLGTLSAVAGLLAMLLYLATGAALFDALGALLIGALIVLCALVLVDQARSLIAGRAVDRRTRAAIEAAVCAVAEVQGVNRCVALCAGAGRIEVDLDLDLREGLETTQVEAVLDRVEAAVRARVPAVHCLRAELNSPPAAHGSRAPSG